MGVRKLSNSRSNETGYAVEVVGASGGEANFTVTDGGLVKVYTWDGRERSFKLEDLQQVLGAVDADKVRVVADVLEQAYTEIQTQDTLRVLVMGASMRLREALGDKVEPDLPAEVGSAVVCTPRSDDTPVSGGEYEFRKFSDGRWLASGVTACSDEVLLRSFKVVRVL